MRTASKIAIAIVAIIVVGSIVAAGYVGVVKVPLITPSPQHAYNSYEITDLAVSYYSALQQSLSGLDLPDISVINSYGLEYHFYGTDDSKSTVESYYDTLLAGWTQQRKESGSNWALGVYQNMLYGFAYAVGQDSRLKQLAGYSTVYLTLEGPLSAWQQLIEDIEASG